MKKLSLGLLAAGIAVASSAYADPILLPNGPVFIQYTNDEQFSPNNTISVPGGGTEGNWGIVQVSQIVQGTALNPIGSDIQGGGTTIFNNGQNGGNQVLGIFYGAQVTSVGGTGSTATGGVLDLYWWDSNNQNIGAILAAGPGANRTSQSTYNGFTCPPATPGCTFLVRLDFTPGILADSGDVTTTVSTATNPTTADGTAKSYLSVDTSVLGAWTAALDQNFFTLSPNNNLFSALGITPAPDVRLDSNFTHNGASAWSGDTSGCATGGTCVVGLRSNDPARANVPEPASLGLMGLVFTALAFARRRKIS